MEQAELCLLCGTPVYEYSCVDKPEHRYLVCPSCGFTALEPEFSLAPEQERERYLLHTNSAQDAGYLKYLDVFYEKGIMPFIPSGATLLDFGSGPDPQLARLLGERNYSVKIYDPFFAPNNEALRAMYMAVLLHEVIEHLENPLAELRKLKPLVRHGGSIIIRTQFRPQEDKDFNTWWYRKDPTHRSFFTADACKALADHLELELRIVAKDIVLLDKR